MKRLVCIALVSVFFPGGRVAADEKVRVAILDLAANGVTPQLSMTVSNLLRTELFNTGLFRVVERGEMDRVLGEQQLGATGCMDTSCAVEIGRLVAANKIFLGSVDRLGESFIINARIVDVERGEVEYAGKTKAKSEDDLDRAVERFANELALKLEESRLAAAARKPPSAATAPAAPPTPARTLASTAGPAETTPSASEPASRSERAFRIASRPALIGGGAAAIAGAAYATYAFLLYGDYETTEDPQDAYALHRGVDRADFQTYLWGGSAISLVGGCLTSRVFTGARSLSAFQLGAGVISLLESGTAFGLSMMAGSAYDEAADSGEASSLRSETLRWQHLSALYGTQSLLLLAPWGYGLVTGKESPPRGLLAVETGALAAAAGACALLGISAAGDYDSAQDASAADDARRRAELLDESALSLGVAAVAMTAVTIRAYVTGNETAALSVDPTGVARVAVRY